MALYYLLSYAHDEGTDDRHVEKLHRELSAEVRRRAPVRGRDVPVGFLDVSVRTGTLWSHNLVNALSTCSTLVALCSPAYFASAACGREWELFARRVRGCPSAPPALIPLRWLRMEEPEPVAAPYQNGDIGLGDAYRVHEVRDLVRLRRLQDDFKQFVSELSRLIIDVSRRHPVPQLAPGDRPADFYDIPPAFGTDETVPAATAVPVAAAAGGPALPVPAEPDPAHEAVPVRRTTRPQLSNFTAEADAEPPETEGRPSG